MSSDKTFLHQSLYHFGETCDTMTRAEIDCLIEDIPTQPLYCQGRWMAAVTLRAKRIRNVRGNGLTILREDILNVFTTSLATL